MTSSFVRAHPPHPKARSASFTMMAASASSIRGPWMAIRPRTPLGTSTAAHFRPFFGSSGVIWRGGESKPAVWTRSRIPMEAPRGSWP